MTKVHCTLLASLAALAKARSATYRDLRCALACALTRTPHSTPSACAVTGQSQWDHEGRQRMIWAMQQQAVRLDDGRKFETDEYDHADACATQTRARYSPLRPPETRRAYFSGSASTCRVARCCRVFASCFDERMHNERT